MKKNFLFVLTAILGVMAALFAGPSIAEGVNYLSALGWGSGLSLLGAAMTIATNTATTTDYIMIF